MKNSFQPPAVSLARSRQLAAMGGSSFVDCSSTFGSHSGSPTTNYELPAPELSSAVKNARATRERVWLEPCRLRTAQCFQQFQEAALRRGWKSPALTRPDESFFNKR